MKTNRIVIVQCRLSSTRLPEKALKNLGGKTVLDWVLNSMHQVPADYYYVATDSDSYGRLLPVCEQNGFNCFAGDLNDVLKRFVDLLNTVNVETVIRATADNPFLFYEAAVESALLFEQKNKGPGHCDYLTFSGLPHGSGVEIFSAAALKKAITETSDPYDHEHVGPAFYNHRDKYVCEFVPAPRKYNFPNLRTTIDTYSDYLRAQAIVNFLGTRNEPYTTDQILSAFDQKSVVNPVVLVPSTVKGHGTGHLHRCLNSALNTNFFVYIPEDKTLSETDSIISEYKEKGLKQSQIISQFPDETYSPVIISDTFELQKSQIDQFSKAHSFISIDEGSDFSDYCDYLLDIIPSCNLARKANIFDSSLIQKPQNIKTVSENQSENKINKVLLCLGGEDPAGLTVPSAVILKKVFPEAKITVILSRETETLMENVWFTKPIKNLREKLADYDLVITHYGLTAFEATYAGCAVILMPTSKLHVELAKKYNFAYVADKEISESSFSKALKSPYLYPKLPVSAESSNLSECIKTISRGKRLLCPVCGKTQSVPDKIVSRNAKRTYRRCQECGIVYMSFTIEEDKKYQKAYFFEDYKKQYGKTYQEDFSSIKNQGCRRLEVIKTLSGFSVKDKSLLDIGCAYGPFLSAASDLHMNPFGTDISEDAVNYVQEDLKLPAAVSAFPDIDTEQEFGITQFDVVTMWYVIEHFKDLDSVLKKTSRIVKTGGIFAFSTPSGEGVSAVSNKDNFYTISPSDHYTIWEPSKANEVLQKYGFKVEKIVSTGHHPERFPSIKKSGAKPGSIRWNLVNKYSQNHKLGDTVEIYCKKIW